MFYSYDTVSKAWATKFLNSHSTLITLANRPTPTYGSHFVIGEFSLHNRSGSSAVMGIGGRIQASNWRYYEWDDSAYAAGTVLTDDTTDAQSAATADINLATLSVNDDGFAIGCDVPFNMLSLNVTQLCGSGAVWAAYYSTVTAGTGFSSNFTALTNFYVDPDFSATGERIVWFDAPADWHKVESATAIINRHGRTDLIAGGYPATPQYLMVFKATTGPATTRGQASIATLGHILMSTEGVGDGQLLTNIGGIDIKLPGVCDAICAATSVANPQNRVDLKWRYSG